MAGNRNTMIALLLAAIETTEGTDASPVVASNAIQIVEPMEASGEPAFKHPRPKLAVGAAIQASPPLTPKGFKGSWQSNVHMRGTRNGAAYAANNLPELDPFWQSAGFAATLVTTGGAESVTYKPAATNLGSHTEYYYVDGRLKKLLGTKTDIDLTFDAGGPMVAALKRVGLYQPPTDAAVPAISGTPFGTSVAPVADNIALTLNFGSAFTAGIIRKFGLNLANKIAQRANANVTGGLSPDRVRERTPKFTLTLEDELAATINFEAYRVGNTPGSLSFTIGGTQYNKIQVTLPNVRIEDVKVSSDNGTELTTISGGCYDSTPASNDAVQIQYL